MQGSYRCWRRPRIIAYRQSAVASIKIVLTFLVIAAGLAGRAALDKVLTLRGGAELVALWAQISSVIEVVIGVVAAGVGTGLVVYVARAKRHEAQLALLHRAQRTGLGVALPAAVACAAAGWSFGELLSGARIAPATFAIAAAAGWVGVVPLLISNYWLGQQRRGLMLALALAQAALMLFASIAAPIGSALEWVAFSQALPAILVLFLPGPGAVQAHPRRRPHPLSRYVLPGLAIGILSPVSMLAARATIGESLSWHDAGVMQALLRITDWICIFAGSYLSLHYLPRFAAARSGPALGAELRDAVRVIMIPSAVALGALFLAQRPLLAALYDAGVEASDAAAGLFFLGSLVRIGSWIPLVALYALRRTREITIGEFLSLPLFALLLIAAGRQLSLELAGALWLLAYSVYSVFNVLAVRRCHQ